MTQVKTAVVYGATSGMAQALSRLWAPQQAHLILVGRDLDQLEVMRMDLLVRGASKVQVFQFEFQDLAGHRAWLERLHSQGVKIDTIVCAQGVLLDQERALKEAALLHQLIQVNYVSVLQILHDYLPIVSPLGLRHIIVFTSVAGDRGRASNFLYGSSKAALQTYLSGLRARLFGQGVQVLDVRPGFVATAMTAHLAQGPLFVRPEVVALDIERARASNRAVLYTPWFWWLIMGVIRLLPNFIFHRLKL